MLSAAGFRLKTTAYMTSAATHWINCAKECVEEPCCRSINFKKIVSTKSERNCEMLHNVVYNTSENLLENNASYDYIYFINPRKVRRYDRTVRLIIFKQLYFKFKILIDYRHLKYIPRANGAERRSGHKSGRGW